MSITSKIVNLVKGNKASKQELTSKAQEIKEALKGHKVTVLDLDYKFYVQKETQFTAKEIREIQKIMVSFWYYPVILGNGKTIVKQFAYKSVGGIGKITHDYILKFHPMD